MCVYVGVYDKKQICGLKLKEERKTGGVKVSLQAGLDKQAPLNVCCVFLWLRVSDDLTHTWLDKRLRGGKCVCVCDDDVNTTTTHRVLLGGGGFGRPLSLVPKALDLAKSQSKTRRAKAKPPEKDR